MREKRGKKPMMNSSFDKLIKVKLHGKLDEIFSQSEKVKLTFLSRSSMHSNYFETSERLSLGKDKKEDKKEKGRKDKTR